MQVNTQLRLPILIQSNESIPCVLLAIILVLCLVAVMNGPLTKYALFAPAFAIPPDQRTVVQSTWALPGFTQDVRNMISDFAGNAYFSETGSNKMGRLEPTTNMITEWQISSSGNSSARPTGIAFDPSTGSIYFAESGTNKIGRLEPTANMITEWQISSSGNSSARPTGIAFDTSTGSIYFAESGKNKIGRLDPATNTITEWSLPNGSKNMALGDIIFDPDFRNLYYITNNGYAITRLDPATNTFTEWTLPISSSNISDITSGFGIVSFTESGTNKIGRLDPATNTITELEISSSGNSTARPTGIAFDTSTGSIYFTESGTNKIGRLDPATNVITKWDVGSKPLTVTVTPAGSVFYIDEFGRIGRLG
jgi:virginiamycin B lyase